MNNIWSIINVSLRPLCIGMFLLVPLLSTPAMAAQTATSSEDTIQRKYDRRVQSYRKAWNRIIPTYTKLQYAGGMGLVSLGVGWDYGKHQKWETELFLGIIPRYSSDEAKATFTLKQNYIPWRIPLSKAFQFVPLTCSLYLNTVFNDEFWTQEPERYPKGYYGFSTRVRINISMGQRIRLYISRNKRHFVKSVSLYYEVSTCDLYLISAITNHLKPSDYLRLSFGIKSEIF